MAYYPPHSLGKRHPDVRWKISFHDQKVNPPRPQILRIVLRCIFLIPSVRIPVLLRQPGGVCSIQMHAAIVLEGHAQNHASVRLEYHITTQCGKLIQTEVLTLKCQACNPVESDCSVQLCLKSAAGMGWK